MYVHDICSIVWDILRLRRCNVVIINFFFFNDMATTEIYTPLYTLSLHDALPIYRRTHPPRRDGAVQRRRARTLEPRAVDRKSTRLNSSHIAVSRMPSSA